MDNTFLFVTSLLPKNRSARVLPLLNLREEAYVSDRSKVVYPGHGVGLVESIEEKNIQGSTREFFMLRILENNTTIMIPTENVASLGLRPIVSKETVSNVYRILRTRKPLGDLTTWNRRYREYSEKIKSGAPVEIAYNSSGPPGAEIRKGVVFERADDARHRPQPACKRTSNRQSKPGRTDSRGSLRHVYSGFRTPHGNGAVLTAAQRTSTAHGSERGHCCGRQRRTDGGRPAKTVLAP